MSFSRLSANAIAAMLQVVASALLLFELYRFLAQTLGPAQLGLWSLVVASVSVAQLAEFGLGAGMLKFVAEDLGAGRLEQAGATVVMSACTVLGAIGILGLLAFPLISTILLNVVTDPSLQRDAIALLPWALASLWISSVGNVFAGALDASQRSTGRAVVVTAALAIQLMAAYVFVPRYGILGMGPIQLFQSTITVVALMFLAHTALRIPWRVWGYVDKKRLIELLQYGATLQLATVGQLLFDPVVKALMASFGGLAATGYYEMANRAVMQFRAILVSAFRMLVPYLATRAGGTGLTSDQVRLAYLPAYRLLFVVLTPYFAALGIVLPVLLTVWVGHFDTTFVIIGFACLVGWYVNTLAVPAYMFYLAVGRLRWIMWTQVAIGLLNVVLGFVAGAAIGPLGVTGGAMLALAIGSVVVIVALHLQYQIAIRELFPSSSGSLLTVCLAGLIWGGIATYSWQDLSHALWSFGTGALLTVVISAGLVWRHPSARDLASRLRSRAPNLANT